MSRWARSFAAIALLVALAGCVRLEMDLTVATDDTLTGAIVVAFDTKAIGPFVDEDSLLEQVERQNPLGRRPAHGTVTVERYEAGGMIGRTYRYAGVPLQEFNAAGGLRLRHEQRRYVLDGVLDLTARGETRIELGTFTDTARASVRFTFPGEVLEANGQVAGRTVTWTPPFGAKTQLSATADDGRPVAAARPTGAGGAAVRPWLIAAGGALAGIAAVGVALALIRRRRLVRARGGWREPGAVAPAGSSPGAALALSAGGAHQPNPTLPLPLLESPDALIKDPRWAQRSPTDPWSAGQQS